MKIIVTANALNEAHNIERFCEGYSFADKIVITDGGSQDGTQKMAESYSNVEIINVSLLQIPIPDDPYAEFGTSESGQIKIQIERAKELGADWIFRDDCDCWPNPLLRRNIRGILERTSRPMILAHRLYIWGQDEYFPKFNMAHSLWAWQPERVDIWVDDSKPWRTGLQGVAENEDRALRLDPPLVLLHFFCTDEETVKMKMARKKARGKKWTHPLKSIYAPPEMLPEWALQ